MKGSLMKPPVVADLYDHKLYPSPHAAPRRTTSASWTASDTSGAVSYSTSRGEAWT
jgi:hypothetical protein